MVEQRMPISKFVDELVAAVERKDGYIMGSKGQNPKKWSTGSWWFTQYSGSQRTKALYWRANAQRVFDCNGLAEGIYEDYTGVNINTKARYNYANWCTTKGTGLIPVKHRVPGAAVFWGTTASKITHVAYLYKPVDPQKPSGDWFIIEARGVMHGVVKTRLNSRKPNFWGLMEKYFDYSNNTVQDVEDNKVVVENAVTITGNSVNIRKGPGTSYGVLKVAHKGDKFERVDASDWTCIKYDDEVRWVSTQYVKDGVCTASSLNVRKCPSTKYASVDQVKRGYKFTIISTDGWVPVLISDAIYWVSAKYAE